MKPYYKTKYGKVYKGDCLKIMKKMKSNSVDTIITDPPAGIGFMGKDWDKDRGGRDKWIKWMTKIMKQCKRVIKPGGIILVWSIPRTSHWTATAIEDAGFLIKDKIYHIFGTGFPKSHDISKAIDKKKGKKRKIIKETKNKSGGMANVNKVNLEQGFRPKNYNEEGNVFQKTEPATKEAKLWDGWGTALKPAAEEWILAMKPIKGNFAENALKYGVAGLNIDGGRISYNGEIPNMGGRKNAKMGGVGYGFKIEGRPDKPDQKGRWPSNVILSHHPDCELLGTKKVKSNAHYIDPTNEGSFKLGLKNRKRDEGNLLADKDGNETIEDWNCHPDCPVRILDKQSGVLKSGSDNIRTKEGYFLEHGGLGKSGDEQISYGDTGGASRFFYCAKPSTSERNAGLEEIKGRQRDTTRKKGKPGGNNPRNRGLKKARNFHPTVKPIKFMKYLCKLTATPKGGIVLDPFGGSGTTALACIRTSRKFIIIDEKKKYCILSKKRIRKEIKRLDIKAIEQIKLF